MPDNLMTFEFRFNNRRPETLKGPWSATVTLPNGDKIELHATPAALVVTVDGIADKLTVHPIGSNRVALSLLKAGS